MKSPTPLWQISVTTTIEAEDAVMEMLGRICHGGVSTYFDVEKQTSIISVFRRKKLSRAECKEIRENLRQIKNCGLNIGAGKIFVSKIQRQDWAESWKRHFKPVEIGRSLLIKPSWIKKRPRKNQAVVVLDPGLSFGTGQHPTTAFCLKEIARHRKYGLRQAFLDIGTGSGILAIAAAKLGYKSLSAIDFDPAAVHVARANARANGVLDKIKITRGDVSKLGTKPSRQFDLVCANLISNLLMAEKRKIAAQVKPGGVLVLAGILKTEFLDVQKAFESIRLKLISARSEKEWRSGSFCLV